MGLGEKLRLARQEAGLSQRALCGGEITRNMLSQIEHGTARPSMKTLQYLAARLGKPVSYFLEEEAVISPNQEVMASARRLYDAGEDAQASLVLEGYAPGDPIYDREAGLLRCLVLLRLAEKALAEGREIYAKELLKKADPAAAYCARDLERRKLLLLARLGEPGVCAQLPGIDEELILRAREALDGGNADRAGKLLDAAQDQGETEWLLLRGEAYFASGDPCRAAECFHGAEDRAPRQTAPRLEACYRELGDFRRAYEYACKQR